MSKFIYTHNLRNMKEKPILFSAPGDILWVRETWADVNTPDGPAICYKADGDYRSWHDFSSTFGPDYGAGPSMDYESYPADYSMWWEDLLNKDEHKEDGYKWRSPIHMFRWASRINLRVNQIHVERLQDISELDVCAEGIIDGGCLNCGESEPCGCGIPQPDARDAFCDLWEQINGKNSWLNNPWVWVVKFNVCV